MIAPSLEKEFSLKEWERSKEEFWDRVRKETGGIGKGMFINIGCGVDRGFLSLARPGITLAGVDIVPSLLRHLGEGGKLDIAIAGAVDSLPLREESFDCVCCIDLIHHEWEKAEEILAKFYRILRPGGLLFLEDINAWGLGQFHKSILLPKKVHGALRKLYHGIKGSKSPPAEYEFPTSVFRMKKLLRDTGFSGISAVPLKSCPNAGRLFCRIYRFLSRIDRISRYHNFHYMLRARK